MSCPMVIDGGRQGLEQSLHHPQAGEGCRNAAREGTQPDDPAEEEDQENQENHQAELRDVETEMADLLPDTIKARVMTLMGKWHDSWGPRR